MAVVDREGVVLAPQGQEADGKGLPAIRWSGAAPAVGERIAADGFARGLRLLDDLQALRLGAGEGLEVDIDDPFALVATLPDPRRRVIFPPEELPGALARYVQVAQRLEETGERFRTVDMRMARGPRSPRIILRR